MFDIDPFYLTIRDLNGRSYSVFCYGYQHSIEYLKSALSQITGIDRCLIRLIMNSTNLEDYYSLENYDIDENSRITMVLSMRSGK